MATELELYVTTFKEALFSLDDVQVDSEQKNLWNFVLADLLDRRPMLVEKISVMIMEQGNRHGIDWASGIIKDLITECKKLIEDVENKSSHKLPPKLHTRLILLTIFSENPKLAVPTNQQIEEIGLLNSMISKINTSKSSPKWLAAGLMLIENYQKQQVFNKRMELFKSFIETKTPVWQVLEAKARKWSPLTATENQEVTDAFVQGNSEYKLTKSNEAQFNPAQPVVVRFKNMVVEGGQGPQGDRYRTHDGRNNIVQKCLSLKFEEKNESSARTMGKKTDEQKQKVKTDLVKLEKDLEEVMQISVFDEQKQSILLKKCGSYLDEMSMENIEAAKKTEISKNDLTIKSKSENAMKS
jgi:hypothetical protein